MSEPRRMAAQSSTTPSLSAAPPRSAEPRFPPFRRARTRDRFSITVGGRATLLGVDELRWPEGWQTEAIAAVLPFSGTAERLHILIGTEELRTFGPIAGRVYRGDDGTVMIVDDHDDRRGGLPWPLLTGPVLEIRLLRPRRRALVLFRHPDWTPPDGSPPTPGPASTGTAPDDPAAGGGTAREGPSAEPDRFIIVTSALSLARELWRYGEPGLAQRALGLDPAEVLEIGRRAGRMILSGEADAAWPTGPKHGAVLLAATEHLEGRKRPCARTRRLPERSLPSELRAALEERRQAVLPVTMLLDEELRRSR